MNNVSNCCNANILGENENEGICSFCHEHCVSDKLTAIQDFYTNSIETVDLMITMLEDLRDEIREFNAQMEANE